MHHINTFLKNNFADLLLWFRLPGLVSFAAIILGIWVSAVVPGKNLNFIGTHSELTYATISIVSLIAVLTKKNYIRFILIFLAGALVFQMKLDQYIQQTSEIKSFCENQKDIVISGVVVSNPAPTQNCNFYFLIATDSISNSQNVLKIKKTFICQGPLAPLYGSVIAIKGRVKVPERKSIPFIFNDFDYLISNDLYARITFNTMDVLQRKPTGLRAIDNTARTYVLEVIDNLTNEEYRSVLRAAFIGESRFLSDKVKQQFRKSGIYHLLSISGLHAAMLTAAAFAFLFLIPVHNNIKRCAVIIILWLYQFFIGWQPALLRATIMASVMIAAFLFEKKQYTLQSLGIAGTVILFLSPSSLFTPGFQLSFAATAGIIALYPRLATVRCEFGSPFLRTLINHLLSSFYVSLCGFLFTAPVLLYHFGSISLFGLVSNIAAVIIMTSAMWIFFISLLLQAIFPSLVLFAGKIISLHFDALFYIADLAQMVSFSEIQLPIPGVVITLLYLTVLVGAATAKKTYLIKFLTSTVPLCIVIASVLLFFEFLSKKVNILQYCDSYSSWVSIRWPQGKVWLINYKISSKGKTVQDQIVNQWLRHYPCSSLIKAFFCENKSPTDMKQLSLNGSNNIETIYINDSTIYNIPVMQGLKKQSYKCVLFQNPSPIQLSILCNFDTLMLHQPELINDDKVVLLSTIH